MIQLEVAKKYLGFTEQRGNVIDSSTPFGANIEKAGHNDGEAWCAYAQEALFCESFPVKEKALRMLFSANCMTTYWNFLKGGYKVSNIPVMGSLVIWQKVVNGIQTMSGHAGMCSEVISKTQFSSYEGNTNVAGSREGTIFIEKTGRHTLPVDNGLVVRGFIIIE